MCVCVSYGLGWGGVGCSYCCHVLSRAPKQTEASAGGYRQSGKCAVWQTRANKQSGLWLRISLGVPAVYFLHVWWKFMWTVAQNSYAGKRKVHGCELTPSSHSTAEQKQVEVATASSLQRFVCDEVRQSQYFKVSEIDTKSSLIFSLRNITCIFKLWKKMKKRRKSLFCSCCYKIVISCQTVIFAFFIDSTKEMWTNDENTG